MLILDALQLQLKWYLTYSKKPYSNENLQYSTGNATQCSVVI